MTSSPATERTVSGASVRAARLTLTVPSTDPRAGALRRLARSTPSAVEAARALRDFLLRQVRGAAADVAAALALLAGRLSSVLVAEDAEAEALEARQDHDGQVPRRVADVRSTDPVRGPSLRAAA